MKLAHDVVVVGGGPAGSASAFTLAKSGVDVCIVDKSSFPRIKLCGGLLTLRSKKVFEDVFGADWNEVFEYRSTGIKFLHKDKLLNSVENYSELFFTQRYNFDDHLLNLAKQQGATLYEKNAINSIDLNNKICHLRSGDEIHYKYLIGADGVNSIVAKSIFGKSFNKETIGFALELEVDRNLLDRTVESPEIYFGIVDWGYGWIFPKDQTLTVGIGGTYKRNPEIQSVFKDFLKERFGEIPPGRIKGHYIPFGDFQKTPGMGDALLTGDAAGLVEPITGEGIAFAMQSGNMAAISVLEAMKSGKNAFQIYKGKYTEIAQILNYAKALRYLIFPKMTNWLFIKALPKTSRLPLKHMDLMADDVQYNEYVKYIISKILKGVIKRMLFIK